MQLHMHVWSFPQPSGVSMTSPVLDQLGGLPGPQRWSRPQEQCFETEEGGCSMFDEWIKEHSSSILTKHRGWQQCDNDISSPKLKLCIKSGWQFQEAGTVARDQPPLGTTGCTSLRLPLFSYRHCQLSGHVQLGAMTPGIVTRQPLNLLPLWN